MVFREAAFFALLILAIAAPRAALSGEGGGIDPRDNFNPFIGGDPGDDPEDEVLPPPWKGKKDEWRKLDRKEKERRFDEWLDSQRRFNNLPPDVRASVIMNSGF